MELDPHVEEIQHAHDVAPPLSGPLSRFNATVARYGMYALNSSPTWTESLALVLVLYVTLIAAAIGVRDAGHIGMESLLILASDRTRERIELLIHVLVMLFGAAMVYNGTLLGLSVATYKIPNLGLPEIVRYVPLVLSGLLIVLFSIEHIIALLKGAEVEPAWH
jgi:TRAP-type transport system small permease protein